MPRRETPPGPRSEIVGANVRAAREEAGLTQGQLADLVGWSQSNIMYLETARTNMRVEQLLDLAGALDVDPCALLEGAWKPKRKRARR